MNFHIITADPFRISDHWAMESAISVWSNKQQILGIAIKFELSKSTWYKSNE